MQWFDSEPSLRVAVITGTGKAFCAGQDLIEQRDIANLRERRAKGEKVDLPDRRLLTHPQSGFMGVSRRSGKKPVVCAVNGWAMGGGFEICLGADMIVASPQATFGLPEAMRGLYAGAGGLSRLVRLAGITIASEVAMSGRFLSAEEAARYLIANRVSKTHDSCVPEAVELASKVASLSPDAIIVRKPHIELVPTVQTQDECHPLNYGLANHTHRSQDMVYDKAGSKQVSSERARRPT